TRGRRCGARPASPARRLARSAARGGAAARPAGRPRGGGGGDPRLPARHGEEPSAPRARASRRARPSGGAMRDCDELLAALLRGPTLAGAARPHAAACAACGALARGLALLVPPRATAEPPPDLAARVLRAAQPLLDGHAHAAHRVRASVHLDGRRLATALL